MDPRTGLSNQISLSSLLAKVLLWIVLCYFASVLLYQPQPWIFLDGVNLIFHEAGHVVFSFFGPTLSYAGGSLLQLLIPLLILIYFITKQQYFSVCFALFWLGDNLINVAVYIKDAPVQQLPLIGGDHDWAYLLNQWQALDRALLWGNFIAFFGKACLILSLALMTVLLIRETFSYLEIRGQ